jgi:hypothetical protein
VNVQSAANEVLLPRTDAGALAQVIGVIVVTVIVVVLVRRERSLVLLATGAGMVLLGVMGLRTLH